MLPPETDQTQTTQPSLTYGEHLNHFKASVKESLHRKKEQINQQHYIRTCGALDELCDDLSNSEKLRDHGSVHSRLSELQNISNEESTLIDIVAERFGYHIPHRDLISILNSLTSEEIYSIKFFDNLFISENTKKTAETNSSEVGTAAAAAKTSRLQELQGKLDQLNKEITEKFAALGWTTAIQRDASPERSKVVTAVDNHSGNRGKKAAP